MKDNRKANGGPRRGAGRPKKFNNPSLINFLVEEEDKIRLKEKYGKTLNAQFIKWVKEQVREED